MSDSSDSSNDHGSDQPNHKSSLLVALKPVGSQRELIPHYRSLMFYSTTGAASVGFLTGSLLSIRQGSPFIRTTARFTGAAALVGFLYSGLTELAAVKLNQTENTLKRNIVVGAVTGALTAGALGGTSLATGGVFWGTVLSSGVYAASEGLKHMKNDQNCKNETQYADIAQSDNTQFSFSTALTNTSTSSWSWLPSWFPVRRSNLKDIDRLERQRAEENPNHNRDIISVTTLDETTKFDK